jgi:pimeloyl-ACP methyl ester carboxylesterase
MVNTEHKTGSIVSGDVELAYHAFGSPGGETPLLIMHGTNYYDSTDWLEVAETLASDREVVTFDHRGFGQSGWSACKDYSVDAFMTDVQNVIAHFGWDKPIIFGHSMSGRLVTFFAANFPDQLSRLIIADSGFDHGAPGAYNVSVGNEPMLFESVEAAMAHFAKLANPPRIAHDRLRVQKALRKVEGGYMLLRDPDYRNTQDQTAGAPKPALRDLDAMDELRKVECPTIIIRGLRSTRYPPEILGPLQKEFPDIAWGTVDSEHDIAVGAPDELVDVVRRFITTD